MMTKGKGKGRVKVWNADRRSGPSEPKSEISQFCDKSWQNGNVVDTSESKSGLEPPTDSYFLSYANTSVHRMMLKDQLRTKTYQRAICLNTHLFAGKVVLDVGCGTGILSLFAAKAGAARVIGIERSDMAIHAEKIVKDNNFENVITIVKGKVEEVDLPHGITQVDVIVSEWMGYCLLNESMLDTVLFARDKWLKPKEGILFPDKCGLYIYAISDQQGQYDKIGWLKNYRFFNISPLQHLAQEDAQVFNVSHCPVITNHCRLIEFNLYTVKVEELRFKVPFNLTAQVDGTIHAFVTYFSVEFSKCLYKTWFSTNAKTHWKQTVFYLHQYASMEKGEKLIGWFQLTPIDRTLDIKIDMEFVGRKDNLTETIYYCLG